MLMDLMCIPLTKQKETADFVWYKFEISLKESNKKENRYGVFKFKKDKDIYQKIVAGDSPEDFIFFEKDETDQIFWNNTKILAKCLVKMIECTKNKNFPDTLLYASG